MFVIVVCFGLLLFRYCSVTDYHGFICGFDAGNVKLCEFFFMRWMKAFDLLCTSTAVIVILCLTFPESSQSACVIKITKCSSLIYQHLSLC